MNNDFEFRVKQSDTLHMPLPLDDSRCVRASLEKKPVLARRELSRFDHLDGWSVDPVAQMKPVKAYGRQTIRFTSPTRMDHWPGNYARIYYTPYLTKQLQNEDWREFNRLSIWVRPEMPGFHFVSLHIQLVNEGAEPVPDRYERLGCHHMNLRNHQWNHCVVEIPDVPRDCVTALRIGYDMIGNQNGATETACFYLADLAVEAVETPQHCIGWEPEPDIIVCSGTGYQPQGLKTALMSGSYSGAFQVKDDKGQPVYQGSAQAVRTDQGDFSILDFTPVDGPGQYCIECQGRVSEWFPIAEDVWKPSVYKTINLYFCERCGYKVPEIHEVCHMNAIDHYGEQSVVANGGWHDAADMSQNLTNTAEAVYAFFSTCELWQQQDQELSDRLREEGIWGLKWMLKTRFSDGFRTMGSGGSVWTSNRIGACDQLDSQAQDLAIENFMAAAAQALAARNLSSSDRELAEQAETAAREDWLFAYRKIDDTAYEKSFDPARVSSPLLLYAYGSLAACEIYRTTKEQVFADRAAELAKRLLHCQQQEKPDWDIPISGFFYRDEQHSQIQHYNHRSHEHAPMMALELLCRTFPQHIDWILWHQGIVLYTQYLEWACKSTAPYTMAPASIYHIQEAKKDAELFLNQQAFAHPGMLDEYEQQVRAGVDLGQGNYLKRFPVWFSYRGNSALVLAGGNAALYGALARRDIRLLELARRQLEWITGKNPFFESLMLDEGARYAEQYVCLPGPISGGICVGIQSYKNTEKPYWPQSVNAVYRELWTHPSIRFLLLAGRMSLPATMRGCMGSSGTLSVTYQLTGKRYEYPIQAKTPFVLELPAGRAVLGWAGVQKEITLLPGEVCTADDRLLTLQADAHASGNSVELVFRLSGKGTATIRCRCANLDSIPSFEMTAGECVKKTFSVSDLSRPWLAVAETADGGSRVELFSHWEADL